MYRSSAIGFSVGHKARVHIVYIQNRKRDSFQVSDSKRIRCAPAAFSFSVVGKNPILNPYNNQKMKNNISMLSITICGC